MPLLLLFFSLVSPYAHTTGFFRFVHVSLFVCFFLNGLSIKKVMDGFQVGEVTAEWLAFSFFLFNALVALFFLNISLPSAL